jgi:hypothetical protein
MNKLLSTGDFCLVNYYSPAKLINRELLWRRTKLKLIFVTKMPLKVHVAAVK